ncbi:MAG: hypothetical protein OXS40_10525, partial [Gammaproteobacteria bacterium]|nr:hypothetical protein [Gammaproteobacteria bacterium]
FNPVDPRVANALNEFKRRCGQSASDHANEVNRHIDALAAEWCSEVERCRIERRGLAYQISNKDKGRDRLLYSHGDGIKGLWSTLHSLRNVEDSALLKAL